MRRITALIVLVGACLLASALASAEPFSTSTLELRYVVPDTEESCRVLPAGGQGPGCEARRRAELTPPTPVDGLDFVSATIFGRRAERFVVTVATTTDPRWAVSTFDGTRASELVEAFAGVAPSGVRGPISGEAVDLVTVNGIDAAGTWAELPADGPRDRAIVYVAAGQGGSTIVYAEGPVSQLEPMAAVVTEVLDSVYMPSLVPEESSNGWIAPVLVGVLVLVLGALVYLRWKQRREEAPDDTGTPEPTEVDPRSQASRRAPGFGAPTEKSGETEIEDASPSWQPLDEDAPPPPSDVKLPSAPRRVAPSGAQLAVSDDGDASSSRGFGARADDGGNAERSGLGAHAPGAKEAAKARAQGDAGRAFGARPSAPSQDDAPPPGTVAGLGGLGRGPSDDEGFPSLPTLPPGAEAAAQSGDVQPPESLRELIAAGNDDDDAPIAPVPGVEHETAADAVAAPDATVHGAPAGWQQGTPATVGLADDDFETSDTLYAPHPGKDDDGAESAQEPALQLDDEPDPTMYGAPVERPANPPASAPPRTMFGAPGLSIDDEPEVGADDDDAPQTLYGAPASAQENDDVPAAFGDLEDPSTWLDEDELDAAFDGMQSKDAKSKSARKKQDSAAFWALDDEA